MNSDAVRWTTTKRNLKGNNLVDNQLIKVSSVNLQLENMLCNTNNNNRNKKLNNCRNCSKEINVKNKINISNFLTKSFLYKLVFLYIVLNLSNVNINSAYGDELYEAVGARGHYTNTWAVHIPGGNEIADTVAEEHGYLNLGQVSFPLGHISIL